MMSGGISAHRPLKSTKRFEKHEQRAGVNTSELRIDVMKDHFQKLPGSLACISLANSSEFNVEVKQDPAFEKVHFKKARSPCIMCVQYIGGCSVHQGVFSTSGGYMSTSGGYMSTSGGYMSTSGGYHEYIGGIS